MNNAKQIENIRKRNSELNKQLEELKTKLENESLINVEVKDLIEELKSINTEWNESLRKIKEYEMQYYELISQLNNIKDIMISMDFTIPWYQKIFYKIKRIFNNGNNVRNN